MMGAILTLLVIGVSACAGTRRNGSSNAADLASGRR